MLTILGLLAAWGGAPSDSTPATRDSVAAAACTPLARAATEAPAVATDVWSSLQAHNGAVRWDAGRGALRLWIQPRPAGTVTGDATDARWRQAVLEAADSWRDVVRGLAFTAERDSARADVVVTWDRALSAADGAPATASNDVGGLAGLTAGRTTLVPGEDGRARSAHVRLAVVAASGARYGLTDARAVARHELGHVLGLAHHADRASVMAPMIEVERLTAGDRAALQLLYALPVGARCPAPGTR